LTRSEIMARVKSEHTSPERIVRSLAHNLGYRFRLHRKDLPGAPDLVFPRLKAVIFVHGCFWHQHACPRGDRMPATNRDYWERKLARNVERDKRNLRALRKDGWRVLVIWECQMRSPPRLEARLRRFLDSCEGDA
jgi:DNA mismatch endonuclease (patch repair protein)